MFLRIGVNNSSISQRFVRGVVVFVVAKRINRKDIKASYRRPSAFNMGVSLLDFLFINFTNITGSYPEALYNLLSVCKVL